MLPRNIVALADAFGRLSFDPQRTYVARNLGDVDPWHNILVPLSRIAQANPAEFTRTLAQKVVPVGGWAVRGGAKIVAELLDPQSTHPAFRAMQSAGLNFLRQHNVPNNRLNSYEWEFWIDGRGRTEPWLTGRPTPTEAQAPIRDLEPGETRRVVQITNEPDSNLIYVEQDPNGGYRTVIDASQSDADPTRVRNSWQTEPTLNCLYTKIGIGFQAPTYWYDPELAPYFPLPKSDLLP